MTFLILQAALVSAFALTAPESEDENTDRAITQPPDCSPRGLACSMSADNETGRQWGCVAESTTAGTCVRTAKGGVAPRTSDSCHQVGMRDFKCTDFVSQ
ncbi:hypothetical protein [Nannocystis pusilla]|uniref:hypothetical protein n=1 Tax=Nannocystis pusilla TaxID=889268 RepID=UPI003B817FB6